MVARVNANFRESYGIDRGVRYVDPVNGSSSNNGLGWGDAATSIQDAYDDLPDTGGAVYLSYGTHDVGAGMALKKNKVVALVGTPTGMHNTVNPAHCTVITSTGTPSAFITMPTELTFDNHDGLSFENLHFKFVDDATDRIDASPWLYVKTTGDGTNTGWTSKIT